MKTKPNNRITITLHDLLQCLKRALIKEKEKKRKKQLYAFNFVKEQHFKSDCISFINIDNLVG